jgi:hypothetical protein
MYEEQMAQLTQQQFNMESASLAMDNMRNTMATFSAMKTANKELKKQYGKVDIDKIEVMPKCNTLGYPLMSITARAYTTTWKTCWNRRTKSKRRSDVRMLCPMSSMKRT